MGTQANATVSDTITMANLGYLQLKGNPGVWSMMIRPGKGREIYELDSISDDRNREGTILEGVGAQVVLDGFDGVTLYPMLKKRPGKESEDILGVPEDNQGDAGFWGSIKKA